MSTELVERLRAKWTVADSIRLHAGECTAGEIRTAQAVAEAVITETAAELTALTAKVALLTEALRTDRLAVIEECAKEIDQLAALCSQQFEALDISREVSTYGIAANAIRALSEPDKEGI